MAPTRPALSFRGWKLLFLACCAAMTGYSIWHPLSGTAAGVAISALFCVITIHLSHRMVLASSNEPPGSK